MPVPVPQSAMPAAAPGASRRAVDDLARLSHWLLAVGFVGAWLTAEAEGARWVHVSLGYMTAATLVLRGVWGWIGPRSAAWSGWLRRLRGPGALRRQPGWQALAVVAMLVLLALAALSGVARDVGIEVLDEVHEVAGNTALLAVIAHLGLVAFGTLVLRQPRLRAMLTGRLPGRGPDLAPARRAHALVWLALVLAFAAWQLFGGDHRLGRRAIEAAEAHEHHRPAATGHED